MDAEFSDQCLRNAGRMHYDVDGYFVVGDDTFIFLDAIQQFNTSVAWISEHNFFNFIPKNKECWNNKCDVQPEWEFWFHYHENLENFLNFLDEERRTAGMWDECYTRLINITGGEKRLYTANCDAYYFPKHLINRFTLLSEQMSSFELTFEFTVPNLLMCLEEPGVLRTMKPHLDWTKPRRNNASRVFADSVIQHDLAYAHPLKWGMIVNDPVFGEDTRSLYCNKAMPLLHTPNTTAGPRCVMCSE